MPIVWKYEYNVGIKTVDDQHRKIVELINKLEEVSGNEEEPQVVHDAFFEIVDYTKYHFAEEEKFLESFNYSDIKMHKAQHKVLIKQVVDMLGHVKRGEQQIGEKLTAMLKNWIIRHIFNHDKIYAKNYLES